MKMSPREFVNRRFANNNSMPMLQQAIIQVLEDYVVHLNDNPDTLEFEKLPNHQALNSDNYPPGYKDY